MEEPQVKKRRRDAGAAAATAQQKPVQAYTDDELLAVFYQLSHSDSPVAAAASTSAAAVASASGGVLPSSVDKDFVRSQLFIRLKDFAQCCKELHLGLTETEIQRVFQSVDETQDGRINFQAFRRATRKYKLLAQVVSNFRFPPRFAVSDSFDFSKSTNDNYKADHKSFFGEYADVRASRDYSWHVNYTRERQRWQDQVVANTVTRTDPQPRPWVVFTAGAMGAGKGYALSWMSQHNFFPLENIVHDDPDNFKQMMPEWNGYTKANSETAGSMCHHESGYLQELVQEVAMRRDQNVWVDGSLRNAKWYTHVFDDIRERFPHYRIAIFYVTASEEQVRKRVLARSRITGRSIPDNVLRDSLVAPAESIKILTPKADFIARIDNTARTPVLIAVETVDRTGCWSSIQRKFAVPTPGLSAFPYGLAPLYLQRTAFVHAHVELVWSAKNARRPFGGHGDGLKLLLSSQGQDIDGNVLVTSGKPNPKTTASSSMSSRTAVTERVLPPLALQKIAELLDNRTKANVLTCSKSYPVNLSSEARELACIPEDAHSFVWVFPSALLNRDVIELCGLSMAHPTAAFLVTGGFAYFDINFKLLAINALTATPQLSMLQFGNPQYLTKPEALKLKSRWHTATIPHLRRKGVKYYTWILPGEVLHHRYLCRYGAFAYLLGDLSDWRDDHSQAPNDTGQCTELRTAPGSTPKCIYFPII